MQPEPREYQRPLSCLTCGLQDSSSAGTHPTGHQGQKGSQDLEIIDIEKIVLGGGGGHPDELPTVRVLDPCVGSTGEGGTRALSCTLILPLSTIPCTHAQAPAILAFSAPEVQVLGSQG